MIPPCLAYSLESVIDVLLLLLGKIKKPASLSFYCKRKEMHELDVPYQGMAIITLYLALRGCSKSPGAHRM